MRPAANVTSHGARGRTEPIGESPRTHEPMKIRGKLTYANVVATLALFVAVGGASAFAAGHLARGSVGPRQLQESSVGTAKIKDKAVTTAKIGDGAVTGTKIDASSLPKVPSAAFATTAGFAASAGDARTAGFAASAGDARTLAGNPASAFARGDAQILTARVDLGLGEERQLFSVPGVGPLVASCKPGTKNPVIGVSLLNGSGATLDETLEFSNGVDSGIFANGASLDFSNEGLLVDRIKVATRTTPLTVATLDVSGRSENTPTACVAFAQTVVSR